MDHIIFIAFGVLVYFVTVWVLRRSRKKQLRAVDYLIGQRVVVDGEIVVVCEPDPQGRDYVVPDDAVWVRKSSGNVTWYYDCSIKPLPNGQV